MISTYDNKHIKWIRNFFKLTQRDFAEKLGTKQQIIAMIETNKRRIPVSIRQALYKVYKINCDEVATLCPNERACVSMLSKDLEKEVPVCANCKVILSLEITTKKKLEFLQKLTKMAQETSDKWQMEVENNGKSLLHNDRL